MTGGRDHVGLVIRVNGPNAWVLDQTRYRVGERVVFSRHPGDPWAFLSLHTDD
jgi:hypothetical protein